MKNIDTYIQQNFYQLGPLLACKPGPGALCLWLSTSFWGIFSFMSIRVRVDIIGIDFVAVLLVLLDCITDAV